MKRLVKTALSLTILFSVQTMPVFTAQSVAGDRYPTCDNEYVLRKITKRFNRTEKIYWQARGFTLNEVTDPHLHNDNAFPQSSIKRRYCHGDAHFEDGKTRRIHYLIEKGAGFAGFTWNVEYCIHGLDPWKYYDGRCRVLSQ